MRVFTARSSRPPARLASGSTGGKQPTSTSAEIALGKIKIPGGLLSERHRKDAERMAATSTRCSTRSRTQSANSSTDTSSRHTAPIGTTTPRSSPRTYGEQSSEIGRRIPKIGRTVHGTLDRSTTRRSAS